MIKTIAILLVMLVVNFLMILSISRAAKRVDYSLRKCFVQRLSHDDLGVDLPGIEAVQEIENEKPPAEDTVSIGNRKNGRKERVLLATDENVGRANYKSETIKDDYKAIKQISGYTPEVALACAKKQIGKDGTFENFKDYKGLYEMLDYDTVYSMNALDPEQQENLLRSALKPEHIAILEEYLEETGKQLDCIEFYGYLNQMASIYNSDFSVITGNRDEDGKELKDGTKLSFDDKICEGTQVIYKNKMYDFSI